VAEPMAIRPMAVADLDEVLAIERVAFKTPWSRAAFRYEITQNRVARCLVMLAERALVGYLCLWEIGPELHVTNVAVHPAWRRRGVARALLASELDRAREHGVTAALLEVRPDNVEARTLYERFGFRVIGTRRGYYFDTGEDALVMEARLDIPAPAGSGNRGRG
jgi:[ribosomal protein S18]-alanine N-acetyltransferase